MKRVTTGSETIIVRQLLYSDHASTMAERVTCRLRGTGPIGFVKTVVPCSLAALRQAMAEQLEALPADGFRFLAGGVTVSLIQVCSRHSPASNACVAPTCIMLRHEFPKVYS